MQSIIGVDFCSTKYALASNVDPSLLRLLTSGDALQGTISMNAALASCLLETWRQSGRQAWSPLEMGMLIRITPVEHAKVDGGFLLAQRMLNLRNYITLHSMCSYSTGGIPETKQCTQYALKTLEACVDLLGYARLPNY